MLGKQFERNYTTMLKGVRIIDFSNYLPGPYGTMRLADMGAEVIKVEPPNGDPARTASDGLVFRANNRNKKSMSLNLKDEEDVKRAQDLITKADVVIESFRPGVMERLGLSYEQVKIIKPDIIYCAITGYGQTSSMNHLGSHDLNYMALSGVLSQLKDEAGVPFHPTITFADLLGGIVISEKVIAALLQKEKIGKGTFIDLSLTDAMVSIMNTHVLIEQQTGNPYGVFELSGQVISYAIYETKDHRFVSIGALEPKFWRNFCKAINKEDWITAHMSKTKEANEVFKQLKALFKSRTLDEWTTFGLEVDCCLAPVLETGELIEANYFKEKGLIFQAAWGDRQIKTDISQDEKPSSPPKLNMKGDI